MLNLTFGCPFPLPGPLLTSTNLGNWSSHLGFLSRLCSLLSSLCASILFQFQLLHFFSASFECYSPPLPGYQDLPVHLRLPPQLSCQSSALRGSHCMFALLLLCPCQVSLQKVKDWLIYKFMITNISSCQTSWVFFHSLNFQSISPQSSLSQTSSFSWALKPSLNNSNKWPNLYFLELGHTTCTLKATFLDDFLLIILFYVGTKDQMGIQEPIETPRDREQIKAVFLT